MKTCPECRGWCELDINLSKSIECPICKGKGGIPEIIYIDIDNVAEHFAKDRMNYAGLSTNKKTWSHAEREIYEELVDKFIIMLREMEE